MKSIVLLTALIACQIGFADDEATYQLVRGDTNQMHQVAGRTLRCGSTVLKFNSDATEVRVNGRSATIGWGNGGIDAVINGKDFQFESPNKWYLEDDRCTISN